MTEAQTNVDKINSFLAHLDSQYEKMNAGNFESYTDSSIQSLNSPKKNTTQDIPTPSIPQEPSNAKSNSFQSQQPQNQNINQSSQSIKNQQKNQSLISTPNHISPQDEIEHNLIDDATRKNRSWCERSLEQLEMTIQLLDQCLDNDLKDLSRQQNVINLCKKQIDEVKKIYPI